MRGSEIDRFDRGTIKAKIDAITYHHPDQNRTTICTVRLKSGFTMCGYSACMNRADFNSTMGRQLAFNDAVGKLHDMEAYHRMESAHTWGHFRSEEQEEGEPEQENPPIKPQDIELARDIILEAQEEHTVEMPDWAKRAIKEEKKLYKKWLKLSDFIERNKDHRGPGLRLMQEQEAAMRVYGRALKARLRYFGYVD